MDYKLLYREMNRRRKLEIDLCNKAITTASKLYECVVEICNKCENDNKQIIYMRRLCSDTCSYLESTYQALMGTDTIIEEMCMEDDIKTPTVYSFYTLNDKKKNIDD